LGGLARLGVETEPVARLVSAPAPPAHPKQDRDERAERRPDVRPAGRESRRPPRVPLPPDRIWERRHKPSRHRPSRRACHRISRAFVESSRLGITPGTRDRLRNPTAPKGFQATSRAAGVVSAFHAVEHCRAGHWRVPNGCTSSVEGRHSACNALRLAGKPRRHHEEALRWRASNIPGAIGPESLVLSRC
jgi:hypothetical protein